MENISSIVRVLFLTIVMLAGIAAAESTLTGAGFRRLVIDLSASQDENPSGASNPGLYIELGDGGGVVPESEDASSVFVPLPEISGNVPGTVPDGGDLLSASGGINDALNLPNTSTSLRPLSEFSLAWDSLNGGNITSGNVMIEVKSVKPDETLEPGTLLLLGSSLFLMLALKKIISKRNPTG